MFSVFLASALIASTGTQIFAADTNAKTELIDKESRSVSVSEAPDLRYRSAVAEIHFVQSFIMVG